MFDACSKESVMSSHLVFNGCDDAVKARLEPYWAKKLQKLQKLLVPYRTDLQEIDLTVYCHQQSPQREWYEARIAIHLPTGTLAAQANDKDPRVTLNRATDTIISEIKRHKERVRHDYLFKRKSRHRADLSAAGPLLQRDVEGGRREDFFRLLRPQIRFLSDHARRELRILEPEGLLHRREVTVADLLDEVVTRAWQQFADRPRNVPLDLWLTNLLHETLEQLVKQEPRPHVSLEEKSEQALPSEVPPMEAKQEKLEKEWWDELSPFEQTVLLEDLVPDAEETEAWDELEGEEQRNQLLSLLGELPATQRQAFLLHALENYDTAEMAMLQDRPESQVKADIEAARQTLRDRLTAGGYVQETGKLAIASGTAAEKEVS
jgi:RNA polymerase sigma factor (sigma-70 family)